MLSHGWSPGEFLGAKDAPHTRLYSESSASHIRIGLKDDNLGLGANHGTNSGDGQCTGLDIFQDVLERLNGKDQTQLEAEQKSRADLRETIHAERRWGTLRFVSGGLLVGDRIRNLVDDTSQRSPAPENVLLHPLRIPAALEPKDEVAKPKNRGPAVKSPHLQHTHKPKKAKMSKRLRSSDASVDSDFEKNLVEGEASGTTLTTKLERNTTLEYGSSQPSARTQQRAEKAERKLQRKLKRESKKAARTEQDGEPSGAPIRPSLRQNLPPSEAEHVARETAEIANNRSVSSRDGAFGGIHVVRQRYIRHKKMAMMDAKALHEV